MTQSVPSSQSRKGRQTEPQAQSHVVGATEIGLGSVCVCLLRKSGSGEREAVS